MLRGILSNNFGWKLFSLVLAVALWLTIRTFSNDPAAANPPGALMTHTFNALPVLVVSAAADVREFTVQPESVQVTVSGRPAVIAALDSKAIRAMVDLTEIESARDLRQRVEVSTLPGVTVVSVVPAEVVVIVPAKTPPSPQPSKP